MPFRIIKPATAPRRSLEPGRGESIRLVDTGIGVESLDVHMNILQPNGPRGRMHRHSKSDNVYIVKSGEGLLTIEGEHHAIVTDDVVFIPAGVRHSLSNVSDRELVIYEIYAPAGPAFDFIAEE
jgi:mannose-6-phosphate isomerase-like protein (cupin superfamily)